MKKKTKLILAGILLTAVALRVFKLRQLFFFTMDESLIAFRALGWFRYHRPFLIGGGSPLQVHLPPYFYYLASFFLLPSNFNPIGWGGFAAFFGVLTVFLIFKLTKKIFDQLTGLVAAILYAVSFTAVFFDRHFWPLTFNPLYAVSSLLLLFKLDKKTLWPYLVLVMVMVMSITSDPSNIPLVLAVLVFIINQREKLNIKNIYLSGLSAFAVFFTPLILFDLRHHWVNFLGITKLFEKTSKLNFSLQRLIDAILLIPRSLARFWYSPQIDLIRLHSYCIPYADARQHHLPIILVILAVGVLAWFVKKANQPILRAIGSLLIFYFFGITLFGVLGYSIFDHYLTGLLPIFAIITAFALSKLKKPLSIVLLTILISLNLLQISKAGNPYGLKYKQDLINWSLNKLNGRPFYLNSISKCHRENGLRYLFELTDNPPQQSFMDPNFSWLYQKPPAENRPSTILLVTDKPLKLRRPAIFQQSFGALKAYIYQQNH